MEPHFLDDYEHALRDLADKAKTNANKFHDMGIQADAWDAVAEIIYDAADKLHALAYRKGA